MNLESLLRIYPFSPSLGIGKSEKSVLYSTSTGLSGKGVISVFIKVVLIMTLVGAALKGIASTQRTLTNSYK